MVVTIHRIYQFLATTGKRMLCPNYKNIIWHQPFNLSRSLPIVDGEVFEFDLSYDDIKIEEPFYIVCNREDDGVLMVYVVRP